MPDLAEKRVRAERAKQEEPSKSYFGVYLPVSTNHFRVSKPGVALGTSGLLTCAAFGAVAKNGRQFLAHATISTPESELAGALRKFSDENGGFPGHT